MTYELPEHLIPIFEQHFEAGTTLSKTVSIIDNDTDSVHQKPGFWARRKASKAITHLQACLDLLPNHWQTHWFLGKTYQGLGQYPAALASFQQAAAIQPHHPDVLREASIAAMDANRADLGVYYSALALQESPEDPGLLGNHSINLLVNEKDAEALQCIEKAITLMPGDHINQHAHELIKSVLQGTKKRPTCQEIVGR